MPTSIPPAVIIPALIVIALLLDVADQRKSRATRATHDRQELDFVAPTGEAAPRAAHAINNALAGIQYSFLLIKDSIPADHPNYPSVAAIERGIARIAAVTRHL